MPRLAFLLQPRIDREAFAEGFDFAAVRGLSAEVLQKLERVRPQTIGQASRIQGMTPAAISILLVHLKRGALAAARSNA